MKSKIGLFWREYLPDISLFLSTVVWGLSFTIMKAILGEQISPYLFVFLRFSISAVLLFPFCKKGIRSIGKDGVAYGFFLGFLIFAGFITQAVGITYTTASKSAFITGLSSVFVPFFLLFHRRKLPEPVVIGAIMLAIFGMYLLTGPAGGILNFGDFLTLLCAISFAAQIYLMGIAASKYQALALTFIELATTAIVAGIALFFVPVHFAITWKSVAALLFMTIPGTAVALSVQTWAQKRTSAVRAGLIFSAEPVFAYMFASALLAERFNFVQKIGGAVIILALVLSEMVPLVVGRLRRNAGES